MTARPTSRSRASCCCPCGLGTSGDRRCGHQLGRRHSCYASHHMMLVLLYGLAHNAYPILKPRQFFHAKTKISRTSTRTHRRTVFFFLHVAIRNSLRSNYNEARERREPFFPWFSKEKKPLHNGSYEHSVPKIIKIKQYSVPGRFVCVIQVCVCDSTS